MKTIQIVLDKRLLRAADQAARRKAESFCLGTRRHARASRETGGPSERRTRLPRLFKAAAPSLTCRTSLSRLSHPRFAMCPLA